MSGVKRECAHPVVRHKHGTEQCYISDRCRCDECRAAHAERAAWRRRQYAYGRDISHLVPAAGTVRRLQALMWLGWSCTALGERLGWDSRILHRVLRRENVLSGKAAAVRALYDELWDKRPPETDKPSRISAGRTRALALRRGWLPPLAWDDSEIDDPAAKPHMKVTRRPGPQVDEIAIARAMAGERVRLNSAERAEAVRRMTEAGFSSTQISERIGVTPRTVVRRRAA